MQCHSVKELLKIGGDKLHAATERPWYETRLILAFILNKSESWVFSHPEEKLPPPLALLFLEVIERRANKEPLAKIFGKKSFWKREFLTNQHTLDPRPETELIIEVILELSSHPAPSFLELGVGTGCIILSLLEEFPQSQGVGIDLSFEALSVAQKNAEALGLSNRLTLQQGNWTQGLQGTFDIIISNPPYIPRNQLENLPSSTLYDPLLALDGGEGGLEPYLLFAQGALAPHLKAGGFLILEFGQGQGPEIQKMFQKEGWHTIHIRPDLQAIDRVMILVRDPKTM